MIVRLHSEIAEIADCKRLLICVAARLRLRVVCCRGVLAAARARAETIDRVLAVVAGQLITLTDVTAARRSAACRPPDGAADPVRDVLTKLIDRELMLAEVDRYAPPEPTADAVDREVQRVRARFASQDGARRRARAIGHRRKAPARNAAAGSADSRLSRSALLAPATDRRQALVDDWMAGLRRRGDMIDLYRGGAVALVGTALGCSLRRRATSTVPVACQSLSRAPPTRNCTICSRSKPAWLTIGATHDRRRR